MELLKGFVLEDELLKGLLPELDPLKGFAPDEDPLNGLDELDDEPENGFLFADLLKGFEVALLLNGLLLEVAPPLLVNGLLLLAAVVVPLLNGVLFEEKGLFI